MNRFVNEELSYLDDLLEDFGTPVYKRAPNKAQDLLSSRFNSLDERFGELFEYLFPNEQAFKTKMPTFPLELHGYLYKGILSVAGKYRAKTDIGGGYVGFGGTPRKHNINNQDKYEGYPTESIECAITNIQKLLSYKDKIPVESALEYYQKFVRIHPFYDANGRIGRIIVSSYLHHHGYSIDWKRVDRRRNKFFKQLNNCHDRMCVENGGYRTYLGYLITSFRDNRFIVPQNAEE